MGRYFGVDEHATKDDSAERLGDQRARLRPESGGLFYLKGLEI